MKNTLSILITAFLLCFCHQQTATAQGSRTFDCEFYRITLPVSFHFTNGKLDEGTVFESENVDAFFNAYATECYFSNEISVWDDMVFESYKENCSQLEGFEPDCIERYMLSTKNGKRKCLRISAHGQYTLLGYEMYMKLIMYVMLHRGRILSFCYGETQDYPFSYPYNEAERCFSNLQLK